MSFLIARWSDGFARSYKGIVILQLLKIMIIKLGRPYLGCIRIIRQPPKQTTPSRLGRTMQPEESQHISYETLRSLSTIEIKELLHKKQIDRDGVYDKETLINLAHGRKPEPDFSSQLPENYLSLFEVATVACHVSD